MTALQKFRSVAKSTQSIKRKWPVIRRGDHRQGVEAPPLNRFVRRQRSLCGSATSDNASHSPATRLSNDPQCYWRPPRIRPPSRKVLVCRRYLLFLRQVADTSSPRAEGSHPNPCLPLRVRPLLKPQADKIRCRCDDHRSPTAQGTHLNRKPDLVSLPDVPRKLPPGWRFPYGYGACSDGPPPRKIRVSCRRRCSWARR
jgi:hypothetical protein